MEDTGCAFDWHMLSEAAEQGHEFLTHLDAEIQEELSTLAGEPLKIT